MLPPSLSDLEKDQRQNFQWVQTTSLRKILVALDSANAEAMFVGGCVRDSLLGNPPQPDDPNHPVDIDIATVVTPDQTIKALEDAGLKAVPSGYEHGTITAVAEGITAEITSLRADVDTDGRHAVVWYTDDWQQDWRRRDFTINALYLTPDLKLFDPAGGFADLAAGRVAFIGEAEKRIREDYLRILRFYRFSARFAKELDEIGHMACRQHAEGLQQISAERITAELMKIVSGSRIPFTLKAMQKGGILQQICPVPVNIALAEKLFELSESRSPVVAEIYLAAIWQDPEQVIRNLRLSNAEAGRVREGRINAEWFGVEPDERKGKELLYRHGAMAFTDAVQLAWAECGAQIGDQNWEMLLSLPSRWTPPAFPFSAAYFMGKGVKPGPEMGRLLKAAETKWIEAGYPDDTTAIDQIGRTLL